MAKTDDGAEGLKAIGQHNATILDSYLNNRSIINETEENAPAIKSLLKHHLARRNDVDEPIVINRALRGTLDAVTRSYKLSQNDEEVGYLWKELHRVIDNYHASIASASIDDTEMFLDHAFEVGLQLVDSLQASIANYSNAVSTGFNTIQDLDLRAKENRAMILKAQQFNNILEDIDLGSLHQWAGDDTELRKLLRRTLPIAFERCGRELSHAIKSLVDLLHATNNLRESSKLIDSVANYLDTNPSYVPDLDDIHTIPETLNRAVPAMQKAYPNVLTNIARQEDLMADIAATIELERPKVAIEYIPEPVEDEYVSEFVDDLSDEIYDHLVTLITAVSSKDLTFSAWDAYQTIQPDCDVSIWMMALVNIINGLKHDQRAQISLQFDEEVSELFSGNTLVNDVFVSPSRPKAAA